MDNVVPIDRNRQVCWHVVVTARMKSTRAEVVGAVDRIVSTLQDCDGTLLSVGLDEEVE